MTEVSAVSSPAIPPEELEPIREEASEESIETKLVKHAHAAKGFLFASILLTLFIAVVASVVTESGVLTSLIGFIPTVLTVILFLVLLEGEYKDALFWMTPVALSFAFLIIAPYMNPLLNHQLDVPALTGINMLIGYIILAIMLAIEYARAQPANLASLEDIEHFEPKRLEEYIHTIEDKCKALNFAIGRVYKGKSGGSKELREKIKVPSEWYNSFNNIRPEEIEEQKDEALELLANIQARLQRLLLPEKDLFTESEVKGLKNLARDKSGKDRIIDVLTVNDEDPIEDYFLGAMDFCKKISAGLEENDSHHAQKKQKDTKKEKK